MDYVTCTIKISGIFFLVLYKHSLLVKSLIYKTSTKLGNNNVIKSC